MLRFGACKLWHEDLLQGVLHAREDECGVEVKGTCEILRIRLIFFGKDKKRRFTVETRGDILLSALRDWVFTGIYDTLVDLQ